MTSKNSLGRQAFVWVWLPDATTPIVAGKLRSSGNTIVFNYGKSYLERDDAIPLYDVELPLKTGELPLLRGLSMPSCIRDGAPDAWGRRVLLNKILGQKGREADVAELHELTYLLESGSDRVGALDFQHSATEYVPRAPVNASLQELQRSAGRVEQGIPLTYELDQALHHGSSIGGARPKALIQSGNRKYVAKFSSATDLYSVVKAEFIAMRLASFCGLDVAPVQLVTALNKDVLLIERFDRILVGHSWQRLSMISALTILGLDEMMARYASYEDLAEIVRHKFTDVSATLKELFSRLVFNILVGNTDDHARNHAAFWDGQALSLTPAYDLCPQGRSGGEASQGMLISGNNRMSRMSSCLEASHYFFLSREESIAIACDQVAAIGEHWFSVCEEADLSETDRTFFWGRQFLNRFAFDDLDGDASVLIDLAGDMRGMGHRKPS